MSTTGKTRVAVLFGGRSTEHEISIITALQVMDAFDSTRYDIIPVYVDPEGYWYTGEILRNRETYLLTPERKKRLQRISLTTNLDSDLIEVNPPKGWFGHKSSRRIPVDVFFPAFHGTFGEDGCIQGLLEFIGAAYTGCGPRAAAVGMNKHTAKQTLSALGIPVLPGILLDRRDWEPTRADQTTEEILKNLDLPLMVKPCNLGSSIGISAAVDEEQLMVSIAGAFVFDNQVIIEPLLNDMYELNISVLEDDPPRLSAIERPRRTDQLLTFEEKYLKGGGKKSGTKTAGMASLERDIHPEGVPDAIKDAVRRHATKAFNGLDCRGLVRFDFMVDRKKENAVYLNEVNTLPGSFAYYLWEAADPRISFTDLLSYLVNQSQQNWRDKKKIRRIIERRIFTES